METAEQRARMFVAIFFLAATAAFLIYRRVSVADRLVSMDEILREEAGDDLKALSEPAKAKLIPQLISSLKSREPAVRFHAARTLGMLGPAAGAAIPVLLMMLNDTGMNSTVGVTAADAFARIAPDPVPRLMAALKDKDLETRRNVACALADLGPRAGAAVPLLTELTKDADPELRQCSRRALGAIVPAGRK
ncbi:MAG: HEAT repeat domain-containing protein [Elusimicrobia bacterium]|nr:HEAT repeat domain-containing protein [Elusimicrobiota bacterium]